MALPSTDLSADTLTRGEESEGDPHPPSTQRSPPSISGPQPRSQSLNTLHVQWNWFLIFLPVWVFDGILILMLAIKMAGRCKPGYDPRNGSPDLRLRAWYLAAMLLKLGFCLTLCAKLEKLADVKLTFVCIPLWTVLLGALVELGLNIFPERREA
ncbi:transmembrane protein 60-like isoform X1 [Scophthalmus maximus]|uniref:transmembrane protein 60-like isoform X1 n=1 Tax=Scophthalmus maximus TaxID=52904 RepID=UPI0015E09172|nr:transmembrane protein 60-like isoform X1 [Scophthalmus maximus]